MRDWNNPLTVRTEDLTVEELDILRHEIQDLFYQLPVSADELLPDDFPDRLFWWLFE